MDRDKFLIVGGGGREAAFASRLAEDARVYAVMPHKNPGIASRVTASGGMYMIGDADNPGTVAGFADANRVDYAFVNADQPLANGVVDALLDGGIKAVGATREASRIEWDKAHSMRLMERLCPEFTPFYRIVSDAAGVDAAISEFESRGMDVVVKPRGLTGGKGVKVMPSHLGTYQDCAGYAAELLSRGGGAGGEEEVVLTERLDGAEFTVMGLTDGEHLAMAPASYDYPFRYEGDKGPGTGGMGCFTCPQRTLPFMTDADYEDCRRIMQRVIDDARSRGTPFTGVLNGGFFKTGGGIRFMEFNARFGDPEVFCVLGVLDGSFSRVLAGMWDKTLSEESVSFVPRACVTKYLVASEYPGASMQPTRFSVDADAAAHDGVKTFFASCIEAGGDAGRNTYDTLQRSRVVAFAATGDTVQGASAAVDAAITAHVRGGGGGGDPTTLEYRRDVGSAQSLARIAAAAATAASTADTATDQTPGGRIPDAM